MPYTLDNPPSAVKKLPKHCRKIFVRAFNNAIDQYDGDESRAFATAWAAVKTKCRKEDGKWIQFRPAKEASREAARAVLSGAGIRETVERLCP